MTTYCLKPIRVNTIRLTKLDACGAPIHGPKASIVSDGLVSIEVRMEYEDPTEYKLRGANDKFIVNDRGRPLLKWASLTINMGNVDPELYNMATGSPLVMNDAATPEAVGVRIRENVFGNFALEGWTDLSGQPCTGGAANYGYVLFPWIVDAVIGDFTLQNELITFPIQTARTHNQSLWGVGPYNVDNKISAPAGPSPLLTAITSTDHMDMHLTTLAPPVAACGAVTLP
jgi:hypothetical protein